MRIPPQIKTRYYLFRSSFIILQNPILKLFKSLLYRTNPIQTCQIDINERNYVLFTSSNLNIIKKLSFIKSYDINNMHANSETQNSLYRAYSHSTIKDTEYIARSFSSQGSVKPAQLCQDLCSSYTQSLKEEEGPNQKRDL